MVATDGRTKNWSDPVLACLDKVSLIGNQTRTRLNMTTRDQRSFPPYMDACRQRRTVLITLATLTRAMGSALLACSVCFAQDPKSGHSLRTQMRPQTVQNAVLTRVQIDNERPHEIDLIRYDNQPASQQRAQASHPGNARQSITNMQLASAPGWGNRPISAQTGPERQMPNESFHSTFPSSDSEVALQHPVLWWENQLRTSILRDRPPTAHEPE